MRLFCCLVMINHVFRVRDCIFSALPQSVQPDNFFIFCSITENNLFFDVFTPTRVKSQHALIRGAT